MYMQCKHIAPQVKIVTSYSQEPVPAWYKPGGTMLLVLEPWTGHIVTHSSDTPFGCWSYMEFVEKQ